MDETLGPEVGEVMEEGTSMQELTDALGYGTVIPEPKAGVHTFLQKVVEAQETTKLGNLDVVELGNSRHPFRTYKNVALMASHIMGNSKISNYFRDKAELITASSLSKDAKLIDLAVITRREVGSIASKAPMKENKGWFKKKNKGVENE